MSKITLDLIQNEDGSITQWFVDTNITAQQRLHYEKVRLNERIGDVKFLELEVVETESLIEMYCKIAYKKFWVERKCRGILNRIVYYEHHEEAFTHRFNLANVRWQTTYVRSCRK